MCPTEELRRRRRPEAARAQEPEGRRGLLVQAAVRRGAGRGGLSRGRARISTPSSSSASRAWGRENRNEAARFVTLIDALYEHKVKLLAGADAEPEQLYVAGDGAFEFERTASRLAEMQSDEYLALGHGQDDAAGDLAPAR